MATSTQNLTHSDFSLGYQVELAQENTESEGENDDSEHDATTFKEWTKPGDSDNDADEESDNFPDSTVNETVAETHGKQEGLVPYVVSDSDKVATQETAPKQGLQPPCQNLQRCASSQPAPTKISKS